MNTAPFSTRLKGRLARLALTYAGMAVTGLIVWFGSADFQDFAGDQPWLLAAAPVAVAVLTQVGGHLAGKVTKP